MQIAGPAESESALALDRNKHPRHFGRKLTMQLAWPHGAGPTELVVSSGLGLDVEQKVMG
jgi:hypothetical protein